MPDLSFAERVALVASFLAAASALELSLRGRAAWRWKGSLILVACASLGAAVGAAIDAVTVRASPEYFVHGKGVAPGLHGDRLAARAIVLGARAGTGAGVFVGAIFVLCARPCSRAGCVQGVSLARVLQVGALPVLGALVGGLVAGAAGAAWAPLEWAGGYALLVEEPALRGFLTVWAAHAGVYLGAVLGLVRAIRCLREERRRTPCCDGFRR